MKEGTELYKVTVIFPRGSEDKILIELGKTGVAELINIPEGEFKGFRKEVPPELHRTHTILDAILKLAKSHNIDLWEYLAHVAGDVQIRLYSLNELQGALEELEKFFLMPERIKDLKIRLREYRLVFNAIERSARAFEIFKKPFSETIMIEKEDKEFVKESLDTLRINYEIIDLQRISIIFIDAESEEILSILSAFLNKAGIEFLRVKFSEKEKLRTLNDFRDLLDKLSTEIINMEKRFEDNFEKKAIELAKLWRKTQIMNKLLTAKAMLVRSEYTGILRCWVPDEYVDDVDRILRSIDSSIAIIKEHPLAVEGAPIHMKKPRLLAPLMALTYQMGYPSREDVFPWLLMGFLWAFMFGFMFPDVGQGMILIMLGYIFIRLKNVRKSIESLLGFSGKTLGGLLIMAGSSAVFFGILFGEFFLVEVYPPLLPALHEHWIHDMTSVRWIIKMAILIGLIELLLAMLLYMCRNIRSGHYLEAILGEWGLPAILMLVGLVSLGFYYMGITLLKPISIAGFKLGLVFEPRGASVFDISNPIMSWPLYLFIVGLLLQIVGGYIEGNVGDRVLTASIEIPLSIISNSLSFTRLAGFLIAHVAFSLLVIKFAEMGPLLFWLGLLLMNLLVIILEGLVVSLQSLRLLFYEFATKFYIGGGKLFRPFKL